jgi:hypothetical protein
MKEVKITCSNFICDCGENDYDLLISVDGKPMCERCVQKMIDDLRGWGLQKMESPKAIIFKLKSPTSFSITTE